MSRYANKKVVSSFNDVSLSRNAEYLKQLESDSDDDLEALLGHTKRETTPTKPTTDNEDFEPIKYTPIFFQNDLKVVSELQCIPIPQCLDSKCPSVLKDPFQTENREQLKGDLSHNAFSSWCTKTGNNLPDQIANALYELTLERSEVSQFISAKACESFRTLIERNQTTWYPNFALISDGLKSFGASNLLFGSTSSDSKSSSTPTGSSNPSSKPHLSRGSKIISSSSKKRNRNIFQESKLDPSLFPLIDGWFSLIGAAFNDSFSTRCPNSFHAEDMVLSYRALLIACADGNVQVASQLHDNNSMLSSADAANSLLLRIFENLKVDNMFSPLSSSSGSSLSGSTPVSGSSGSAPVSGLSGSSTVSRFSPENNNKNDQHVSYLLSDMVVDLVTDKAFSEIDLLFMMSTLAQNCPNSRAFFIFFSETFLALRLSGGTILPTGAWSVSINEMEAADTSKENMRIFMRSFLGDILGGNYPVKKPIEDDDNEEEDNQNKKKFDLDSLLNDVDDDDMEKKTEKKTEILKFSFSPPLKIEKVLKILVQKGKDKNSPLWQEHGSLFVFVTLIHLIFTNDSDQWSAEEGKKAHTMCMELQHLIEKSTKLGSNDFSYITDTIYMTDRIWHTMH